MEVKDVALWVMATFWEECGSLYLQDRSNFKPEDGSSIFLRNVGKHLPDCT
jgi:hypothetical protein